MTQWAAVVVTRPEREDGAMVSRLPSFLHPVAGRPLIWHTVRALASATPPPSAVFISGPVEISPDLVESAGIAVRLLPSAPGEPIDAQVGLLHEGPTLVVHASASITQGGLHRLLAAETGQWIGSTDFVAAAIRSGPGGPSELLTLDEPFAVASGRLDPRARIADPQAFVVSTRDDLARAHRRIRDDLVGALMKSGTTFILPDTVLVDVDVRTGRDTIIYPGVVLEGQTTVGDETVIGPGCRIIDSWIGSGVELKGWNYIAHTSVRNRAILEPNVRRGFD
jgi:hypothetical protein